MQARDAQAGEAAGTPAGRSVRPGTAWRRWLPALATAGLLWCPGQGWAAEGTAGLEQRLEAIEVLSRRADAGQLQPIPDPVIRSLIAALQDPSPEVRLRAIDAFNGIGTGAEAAIPHLADLLQDPSQPLDVRRLAVVAIRSIDAAYALEALEQALADADRQIRGHAADALASMGDRARGAVPQLLRLISRDPYSEVRASAAGASARIDPASREVLNALNNALQDRSWRVRRSAADAFAMVGGGGELAVAHLLEALRNPNSTLRSSAARTLGELGPEAGRAIPELTRALRSNDNPFAQGQAAAAIGNIGTDDPAVLEALIQALDHPHAYVRDRALDAFQELIGQRMAGLMGSRLSDGRQLRQTLQLVDRAVQATESSPFPATQRQQLRQTLHQLRAKQAEATFIRTVLLNPYAWLIGSFFALQGALFWLRPLWLLRLDDLTRSVGVKVPLLGTSLSLPSLVLFRFHPRVLDAWVNKHAATFQEAFKAMESVDCRRVFIPSPATVDGRTLAAVSPRDLDPDFSRPVMIWGEGGVGKTSLACQIAAWAMAESPDDRIARHRMLPILIEEDLDSDAGTSEEALLAAILGQLRMHTHADTPISRDLLINLLRKRRLLVIIDHLSEMNENSRSAIDPDNPDFPVNALVVTSRQRDILGKVNQLMIKPLRIVGNRLSSFMEAYLSQQGKRDLFSDSEFFDACSHLSRMVGQREVTAMLATLYARQMISARVEAAQDAAMPASETIPELMLSYLNQLNKELGESHSDPHQLDDRTVHKDAMAVAWQCLRRTFRPGVITRDQAMEALRESRGEAAEMHLRYLEDRLLLVQTIGASKDHLRFSLDPLAEYLAALHLVERYGEAEAPWLEFIDTAANQPGGPAAIGGFLAAVQDCLATSADHGITPTRLALLGRLQALQTSAGETIAAAPATATDSGAPRGTPIHG